MFHPSGGPKRKTRDLKEEVKVRPLRRLRREEEPPEPGVCAGKLREAEVAVADTRRTEVEPGEAGCVGGKGRVKGKGETEGLWEGQGNWVLSVERKEVGVGIGDN